MKSVMQCLKMKKKLKEKEKELTQKCEDLENENKLLKEKCPAVCNKCVPKDKTIQELQKEYDGMKL
ncbi:hypothetical protein Hanom_Chr05g00407371 [Helianthus anomalus]